MKTAASGMKDSSTVSFWLGMAAYLVPSFPIAFVWHLVLFERRYRELGINIAMGTEIDKINEFEAIDCRHPEGRQGLEMAGLLE